MLSKNKVTQVREKTKVRNRNGRRIRVAKALLGSMDNWSIYDRNDFGVILEHHGFSCNSAPTATSYMVQLGYLERVSWGKYRKLRDYPSAE